MTQNFPLTRRAMMTSAAALGCCGLSWSQTAWPQKSVRLIVPYPAGGAADQTGRLLGHALGERLKTSFVIENRAGGNGPIGAAAAAQASAGVHRNPAGVVTPVLQPLQALHQHRHDVLGGNRRNDATHDLSPRLGMGGSYA